MLQEGSESDDAELLRQTAAGDGSAFHTLVDRHADRLFRLAVSLVGSAADAEDVLQESMIGALKSAKNFESRASVKTWLTRIVVTQAALWRRNRKKASSLVDEHETGSPDLSRKIDLHEALQKLSPDYREVILLREFERMSYDEIAQVLEVPRGTVESRLHRARNELKELLRAYQ